MRKKVLGDHVQVKRQLVAPLLHAIPNMDLTSMSRMLMPEMIWWALIIQHEKSARSADAGLALVEAAMDVGDDTRPYFALVSAYSHLTDVECAEIQKRLPAQTLEFLRDALREFAYLYPSFPLKRVLGIEEFDDSTADSDSMILNLQKLVLNLLDRRSPAAVFMYATVVYTGLRSGRIVQVGENHFKDLPEIEKYPNTDLSKQVAASVRASCLGLADLMDNDSVWCRYFWNRGAEISPCSTMSL